MEQDLNALEVITQKAIELGAGSATIINAEELVIEDRFAELCGTQKCPGYGMSVSCPPHGMKPSDFRELVKSYKHCLVFKIDVPMEILLSDDYKYITRLIHELASGIERFAIARGFSMAKGFATGSCKKLFCDEYQYCRVLEEIDGKCRFPDSARPSLSGLGVNFNDLGAKLHWQNIDFEINRKPDSSSMGLMAGIVLIE
ncbi:MAG: DUF2284 domain-containing protein [Chloroflexi bacterium]|nr:DUF2284 domain-containing protein [Chloroflexota bacterium]